MTSGGMPRGKREVRELTDVERDAFITDVRGGVLCFTGDKPYAIPLVHRYVKGTLVLTMARSKGRKWSYIDKNRNVCFNIWQYGEQSNVPSLKEQQYSSVILEGELEEIPEAERPDYELRPSPPGVDLVAFRLKVDTIGTRTVKYVE